MTATLRTLVSSSLLAVFAAGCGSNVRMDPPTIPTPLIEQIPISVGLRMPENFESFVHEEEVLGNEEWSIDLGRSNAVLFSQLFGYMFEDVTVLAPDEQPEDAAFDAVIEPSIDAFEFSVPAQTKTDAFAVWIRYRIKVFDRDGDLVSEWPISAYGKSLTTTLGGSDALQRAAILAMRDAAALLIIKFEEQKLVSSLGASSTTSSGAGGTKAEPAISEGDDDE